MASARSLRHQHLQWFVMNELVRGGDEPFEQRMRLVRLAQELRMELARQKERVILQFDDFNQLSIRRVAAENKAGFLESVAVSIVELEAMPVTFIHHK